MQDRSYWHKDVCQGIVMAYFLVMAAIYPFYAPGGYMRIGEVKYEFFRNVSLITLAVLAGMLLLSVFLRRGQGWIFKAYKGLSATDWFVYGYCVMVMLSYLWSPYKEDALWGMEGWYMGVVTQMIFVLVYFFFSRYFHCHPVWTGIWMTAAAAVFVLGVCNRYSVYPIEMAGQETTFISTLGNINWFCGYWSVTAPLGIVLYWCCERRGVRLAAGIYSVIAMLTGVVQGSNSAYLVFIFVFLTLLFLSFASNQKLYRFLELCMMFAMSCLLGWGLTHVPGLTYNYQLYTADSSRITMVLLAGDVALCIFAAAAGCYIVFRMLDHFGRFHIERHRWWWVIVTVIVILFVGRGVFFLMLDSEILVVREVPFTMERDSYMVIMFDEDWGNGRGATWNCGIAAYQSMDIVHKAIGIGPDCFADYVYDVPELAEKLADQFTNLRLTNAHNEQITMLVNTGVLGWLCYMGIFVTALIRYLKKASGEPALYLYAISMLAYLVHNMVSFQQVLSTPYVFMVIGIGEKIWREKNTVRGMADEQ